MSVWDGLGVNYQQGDVTNAQLLADAAYFKAVGLTSIRPAMPLAPYPYNSSSQSFWRNIASFFLEQGFYVTWGYSLLSGINKTTNPITSSNWPNYHDSVVAEATYLQSQGIILGDFEIGNEMEAFVDNTTVTYAGLYALLQQLAADVKAVYSGKVSYGATADSQGKCAPWIAGGLGNLDNVSFHPYCGFGQSTIPPKDFSGISAEINRWIAVFGSNCYISEFNLNSSNTSLEQIPDSIAATLMQEFWSAIIATGITMAQVFMWHQDITTNYGYLQLRPNGTLHPQWFNFFTSDPMDYTPRTNVASRTAVTLRTNEAARMDVPNRTLIFS